MSNAEYANTKVDDGHDDTTDSGYLSGYLSSGSIQAVSGEHLPQESMRIHSGYVDSGVGLSESFSRVSIDPKQPTNDLSKPSITIATPVESTYVRTKEQPQARIDDVLAYYEQDEEGDTHLHAAIVEGFTEVSLALIRAAPLPRFLDTPNDDARTPLHLAVETQQWKVARWLIVAGARPSPRDARGDSPLHVAARTGDIACVRALTVPVQQDERDALTLSYKPPSYQPPALDQWNYVGQTCIHVASIHGHVEILRHLVAYGADVNAREGLQGYTALHYAVEQSNYAMVDFLLSVEKLDPSRSTYGGRSALQLRLTTRPEICQALRRRGVASMSDGEFDSEDEEDEDSEDEDELPYETQHSSFVSNLVNASA